MVSVLGVVFIVSTAAAILFRVEALPWILSAAVPFSATAGITIAGQSIVMYPLVAIAVVSVAWRNSSSPLSGIDLSSKVGLRSLMCFGVWSLFVTIVCPLAFGGIKVLNPRQGIDDGVRDPAVLVPAISNFAQVGYVAIGIATVIAIGASSKLSPRLPAAAFAVGTVLSSLKSSLPESAQKALFDNSQNVAYTAGKFDGVERMRGIFSEPAALGAFSVAAVVFFLTVSSTTRGPLKILFISFGIWSAVNAVYSFSAGALVTGLVVLAIVSLQAAYSIVAGKKPLSPLSIIATISGLAIVIVVLPVIVGFIQKILVDKSNSSSYENRTAANAFSYSILQETFGLGVGLGSNRPSSFFASVLSATGLLGAILFFGSLIVILIVAARLEPSRPTAWALIAVVISKVTAGPDTSDPIMWFLLAICAHFVWSSGALKTTWLPDARHLPAGVQTVAEKNSLLFKERQ